MCVSARYTRPRLRQIIGIFKLERINVVVPVAVTLLTLFVACPTTANTLPGAEQFAQGEVALDQGQYSVARPLFETAAAKDHPAALFRLGQLYANGLAVGQNYGQAAQYYTRASDKGYAPAQNQMGRFHALGRGNLVQSDSMALAFFRKAAEQGVSTGQYHLGAMYGAGKVNGVQQDTVVALRWYLKSGNQGFANAQGNAAILYYNGRYGVTRDYQLALVWSTLAINQGYTASNIANLRQDALARCTTTCRTQANTLVLNFNVQLACAASGFTASNYCNNRGTPSEFDDDVWRACVCENCAGGYTGKRCEQAPTDCPAGEKLVGTTCQACGNGQFKTGTSTATQCTSKNTTCGAGTYFKAGATNEKTNDDTRCPACGNGQYKTGTSTATQCAPKKITCGPGTYLKEGKGSERTTDDTRCPACGNGQYKTGTSTATQCTSKNTTCGPGTHFKAGATNEKAKDDTSCPACGNGQYKTGTSTATQCAPKKITCGPGTYFKEGKGSERTTDDTRCPACNNGQHKTGTSTATQCAGKKTDCLGGEQFTPGIDSEKTRGDSKCGACADEEYIAPGSQNCQLKKTSCDAGESFTPGDNSVKTRDDTVCTECADGWFADLTSCKQKRSVCAGGEKFTPGTASEKTRDDTKCGACTSGEYMHGSATSCQPKKTANDCSTSEKFTAGSNNENTRDDATCTACPDGWWKDSKTTCREKKTSCGARGTFTAGDNSDKTKDDTSCSTATTESTEANPGTAAANNSGLDAITPPTSSPKTNLSTQASGRPKHLGTVPTQAIGQDNAPPTTTTQKAPGNVTAGGEEDASSTGIGVVLGIVAAVLVVGVLVTLLLVRQHRKKGTRRAGGVHGHPGQLDAHYSNVFTNASFDPVAATAATVATTYAESQQGREATSHPGSSDATHRLPQQPRRPPQNQEYVIYMQSYAPLSLSFT